MRDLINLIEARGLSARKPGEVYSRGDGSDNQITFQDMTFYPEVGSFTSADEMMTAFDAVQKQLGHPIEMVNQPGNNRAFAVAAFDTAVGRRYLAKFARDIKPVRTQNTFFQTSDIPGGFSQTDARGSKEKAGYKPSDVLTNFKSQTPSSIIAQIGKKFGANSDEYRAAVVFNEATEFPITFPGGNMDYKGFRDYFCEMLQPIALINGLPVKGSAGNAARTFMGQDGFEGCVVSFNEGVSGGLYDSLLVSPEGKQIKLSSKGAKGAMASVVNLLRSARELEQAGLTKVIKPYKEVLDILEIIDAGDHNTGPLNLAIKLGMITDAEAKQVLGMTKYSGSKNFDVDKTDLSKNLKKIYKERNAEDPSKIVPINHMVASIAYKVCNEINISTKFSDAAADILNNSAFVQMYTEMPGKPNKDGTFSITGFNTVWPSKLFTQVTLEAAKSYSSTSSSGGKLVFNINKEAHTVPNKEQAATTDAPGKNDAGELVDYIPPRSKIKAGGEPEKQYGSERTLGRKRQR